MKTDEYLAKVSRYLVGMDPKVKKDVIEELRSHILDLTQELGGDVDRAVSQMHSPREVATRYKEVYGYGRAFKALFVLFGCMMAILTLPVLPFLGEDITAPLWISVIFLIALALFLIWTSIKAGKFVGLAAGVGAFLFRTLLFSSILMTGMGVAFDSGAEGIALFFLVSITLMIIGYLPGRTKEKWQRGRIEL